jgi:hypothetical protein
MGLNLVGDERCLLNPIILNRSTIHNNQPSDATCGARSQKALFLLAPGESQSKEKAPGTAQKCSMMSQSAVDGFYGVWLSNSTRRV